MTTNTISGIVAFDLDGTLLRGETVCEILARPLGRIEEMKAFERLTEQTDIAAARRQMAQWYDPRFLDDLACHLRTAKLAPGAQEGVRMLQHHRVEVIIASITWSFAVRWFAETLHVSHWLGTELLPTGAIVDVWGGHKAQFLREHALRNEIPRSRTAAVGDSNNDLQMLREAGLPFYVGSKSLQGLDEAIHLPDADMRVVAARILKEWGI